LILLTFHAGNHKLPFKIRVFSPNEGRPSLRETLKSLTIFCAMLLLLLLISTGCDVNVPGCGKRSLPFFKQVVASPTPLAQTEEYPELSGSTTPAPEPASPSVTQAEQPAGAPAQKPPLKAPQEMNLSSAKPLPAATSTFTPTATPWEIERIAYTTMDKGKPSLWSMNPDGTDRRRITKAGTGSWWPLWSPNGKWLAFLSDMKDGNINLFVVKKGSLEFQQLTQFSDMAPVNLKALKPPFSWSPRSDEIAFAYRNMVWKVKVKLDSASPDTLVNPETLASVDRAYPISSVEWAPHRDNKHVAFLVKKGANYTGLMLVNPRLRDTLVLSETRSAILDISWSPDARRIAYVTADDTIFTASSDASLPKPVIVAASPKLGPLVAYSPAESSMALITLAKQKSSDDGFCVALVEKPSAGEPDPGTLKFLTGPGVDNAVWSPDASKIAYTKSGDLWTMDAMTGANKKLIAQTGIQCPAWSKK
jgi:dipeptidyl aminopeptidase/acylaminoacyl peptidase